MIKKQIKSHLFLLYNKVCKNIIEILVLFIKNIYKYPINNGTPITFNKLKTAQLRKDLISPTNHPG